MTVPGRAAGALWGHHKGKSTMKSQWLMKGCAELGGPPGKPAWTWALTLSASALEAQVGQQHHLPYMISTLRLDAASTLQSMAAEQLAIVSQLFAPTELKNPYEILGVTVVLSPGQVRRVHAVRSLSPGVGCSNVLHSCECVYCTCVYKYCACI